MNCQLFTEIAIPEKMVPGFQQAIIAEVAGAIVIEIKTSPYEHILRV